MRIKNAPELLKKFLKPSLIFFLIFSRQRTQARTTSILPFKFHDTLYPR